MSDEAVFAPSEPGSSGARLFRDRIMPLLAGYWSFGQYWGVWVILVYEVQRDNGISNAGMGARYTLNLLARDALRPLEMCGLADLAPVW